MPELSCKLMYVPQWSTEEIEFLREKPETVLGGNIDIYPNTKFGISSPYEEIEFGM